MCSAQQEALPTTDGASFCARVGRRVQRCVGQLSRRHKAEVACCNTISKHVSRQAGRPVL